VNNWTVTPGDVSNNVSSSTQGVYEEFQLQQLANQQSETVETRLYGNLSRFLSIAPEVQFFRSNPSNVSLTYDVPSDQEKGFYNGTLEFVPENNVSRNVSLRSEFVDDLAPDITSANVEDVASTKSTTFEVIVQENLNLSKIQATIYREVDKNNTTSFEKFTEFDFEEDTSGLYTYTFEDTEETGQYRLDIYAEDTSGNNASRAERFEVTKLDALQVLDENIGFGFVIRGEEKSKQFIRLNQSTPVTVKYEGVTPRNASVDIGIKKTGEPAAKYFTGGVGDTQEIEKPGNYSVVIRGHQDGPKEEIPNAQLSFQTVENHVEVPNVAVQATLIGGYGRPVNKSYSGMNVELYYDNYIDGVPQTAILHAEKPASGCQNTSTMADEGCFPNLNGGIIQNQSKQIDNLQFWNRVKTAGLVGTNVFWLFAVAFFMVSKKYQGFLNIHINELTRRILSQKVDNMSVEEIEDG